MIDHRVPPFPYLPPSHQTIRTQPWTEQLAGLKTLTFDDDE